MWKFADLFPNPSPPLHRSYLLLVSQSLTSDLRFTMNSRFLRLSTTSFPTKNMALKCTNMRVDVQLKWQKRILQAWQLNWHTGRWEASDRSIRVPHSAKGMTLTETQEVHRGKQIILHFAAINAVHILKWLTFWHLHTRRYVAAQKSPSSTQMWHYRRYNWGEINFIVMKPHLLGDQGKAM